MYKSVIQRTNAKFLISTMWKTLKNISTISCLLNKITYLDLMEMKMMKIWLMMIAMRVMEEEKVFDVCSISDSYKIDLFITRYI